MVTLDIQANLLGYLTLKELAVGHIVNALTGGVCSTGLQKHWDMRLWVKHAKLLQRAY